MPWVIDESCDDDGPFIGVDWGGQDRTVVQCLSGYFFSPGKWMATVKDDDSEITWDSDGMAAAEPVRFPSLAQESQ